MIERMLSEIARRKLIAEALLMPLDRADVPSARTVIQVGRRRYSVVLSVNR